ncbi:VOC family protein, partial [Streptomyces sp. 2MCAF27]
MITTDYVPGSPCWVDLGAPDVAAAARFYGSVFGWQLDPPELAVDGYGVFRLAGKSIGGLGRLTQEGARSAWMIYFQTPDAEATAAAVERSGGSIRVAPFAQDGEGRMAQL